MAQDYMLHPTWWNDQHNTAWERVREALRRDWEQTKADLSQDHGQELGQSISDTVRQAAGKDPLPPRGSPTPHPGDWEQAEGALRYGHGAGVYYGDHREWDDELEGKLQREWADLKSGQRWEDIKRSVRRGWDEARRAL